MANHLRYFYHSNLITSKRLCSITTGVWKQQVASMKNLAVPPTYKDVIVPKEESERRLPMFQKIPTNYPGKPPKYSRKVNLIRGLEDLHVDFLHNQYGLVALNGGHLEWGHIEMIRMTVNRMMSSKMFAVWRIEAPWLPRTKKGIGERMGGGKGNIKRYVYPIKTNRVIMELGGKISYEEARPILRIIAHNLPFTAEGISAESLRAKREKAKEIENANQNRLTFKYIAQNDLLGAQGWLSPIDMEYFGRCA